MNHEVVVGRGPFSAEEERKLLQKHRIDMVIAKMGLPAQAEFAALSTGLKRRTLLARALVSGPDILMLDEPTNHLDLESVLAFEQALKGFTGALLAVSHDEAFLQAIEPTHHLTWHATGWQLERV